ncbi:hypothetical protein RK21_01931 [Pseudomonas plecoglossicida]|nr:hypothetical protein RK21_01931 [Pseudomonas plecoglossicida]
MLTGGCQGGLGQMHKTPGGLFGQMPFTCTGPIAGKPAPTGSTQA